MTRGLLALGLLALCATFAAIFSASGTHGDRAAGKSASALSASESLGARAVGAHRSRLRALTHRDCFENPETEGTARIEACGYPGPKDTAVEHCAGLARASGSKTITTRNAKLEDTDITGGVTVDAAGVSLNDDCVIYDGHEASGSSAVTLGAAARNFTITNTTVRSQDDAADSFEAAVSNDADAAGATASKDRFEDCGECLHQEWTLTGSYVIANGLRGAEASNQGEIHREDWYCNDNTIVAEGNTMLNPYDQTAVIFCDTNLGSGGACANHYTVRDNLLAGAGYVLYPCGNASSAGTSASHIEGNRFARCLGAGDFEAALGGTKCRTGERFPTDTGADAHGYWPKGGYFGLLTDSYTGGEHVWSGNYWDDNLERARP